MCLKMKIELADLNMTCLKMSIADSLHYQRFFQPLAVRYIHHLDQWNRAVIKTYSVSCRPILSLGDKE